MLQQAATYSARTEQTVFFWKEGRKHQRIISLRVENRSKEHLHETAERSLFNYRLKLYEYNFCSI